MGTGKKVLVITYYWPPGGGAGVQRWLKFVKYLPSLGWTPVVYTPDNGEMPVIDRSLEQDVPAGTEVIRTPIREPYGFYKKLVGAGRNEKINTGFLTEKKRPGLAEKLSVWIRGNLFIPDARCFWIRPSVKFLVKYLEKNPVDVIVSTGPPHSMHLIAMRVAKRTGIPWVADFRDPWTRIDYYQDLMLTDFADRKHRELEREVVSSANRVIVVTPTMQQEFQSDFGRSVDMITNGYDEDDIPKSEVRRGEKFILAHVGTLVRSRNPVALWNSIAHLAQTNETFASALEIRLTGKIDVSVRESIRKAGLERYVRYIDYLPHNEVAIEQRRASVLLLLLNDTPNAKGILTGKMFEYLAVKRPILCIGPADGDAAQILNETNSGVTVDFNDEEGIKSALLRYFNDCFIGKKEMKNTSIEQYSRKRLAAVLAKVLDDVKISD
jgi:glycosyltransferase involved in cell wall biosynthesis